MERSKTKRQLVVTIALTAALAILLPVFLSSSADATFWSANVESNFTSWSIYRQSQNISFDYSQSVQGTVSPVDYHGRSLRPYYSGYREVKANDVRLSGRTSALQGNYSSAESIYLRSHTTEALHSTTTKEANSPFIVINFFEDWPVILKSSRQIEYSGKEINDREFAENNLDYVENNLLYNKLLSAEIDVGLLLRRMNATVLAMILPKKVAEKYAKDTLVSAEFMPSREMAYRISADTTGIADLKYRLTDSKYDFKHTLYPALSESEEWYIGNFSIVRSIHTKSNFENTTQDEYGDPCCFAGYSDMIPEDRGYLGISTREVFDCSCSKVSREEKVTGSEATSKESP